MSTRRNAGRHLAQSLNRGGSAGLSLVTSTKDATSLDDETTVDLLSRANPGALAPTEDSIARLKNQLAGDGKTLHPGINAGINSKGQAYIIIAFSLPFNEVQLVNLTFLVGFPHLIKPAISYFQIHLISLSESSRELVARELERGFFSFLKTELPSASLCDINKPLITKYMLWQQSQKASASGKALYSTTASRRATHARMLFDVLRKIAPWKEDAARIHSYFHYLPRNAGQSSIASKTLLSRSDLESIRSSCLLEINEIESRFATGYQMLAAGRQALLSGNLDYSNISIAFARLVELYPATFPPLPEIKKDDNALYESIVWNTNKRSRTGGHGLTNLRAYRYPCAADIVPFVVLLTLEGGFNAETILTLNRAAISSKSIFGINVTTIHGTKRTGPVFLDSFPGLYKWKAAMGLSCQG